MATTLSKRDSGGHSFGKGPALNAAGIIYTAFITAYTGFLIFATGMLWLRRHHPAVRIRGFAITIAALISIHVYVAALFIVYPLNGWYRCGTEFWYMSIIFPAGIALFQAANVKLMAVSHQQQELVEKKCCWAEKKVPLTWSITSVRMRLHQLDYVTKTYVAIGLGMLLQLVVTIVLFFGSRRFNPEIGFFGEHQNQTLCRSGPEWVPSVIWQFIWAWFFGPYVLFKTRHIKDTHYWALQTRLSVIACMPGTPMWLGFLYASGPKIAAFNVWWPPAMWFAPGLIAMQLSSVIIPFYDIWRHRESIRPASQHSNYSDSSTHVTSTHGSKGNSATGWEAFEFQLKHNIHTLFLFAATKDFTAENILFLREVRDFKRKWRRRLACPPTGGLLITAGEQRDMFEDAARIYFELVCPTTSRCSVNLDSKTTATLKDIFKDVSYEPPVNMSRTISKSSRKFGKSSRREVAPWESPAIVAVSIHESEAALIDLTSSDRKQSQASEISFTLPEAVALEPISTTYSDDFDAIQPVQSLSFVETSLSHPDPAMTIHRGRIIQKFVPQGTPESDIIPASFNLRVFDKAEASIKYLVYTNTWKSFTSSSSDFSRLNSLELSDTSRLSHLSRPESPTKAGAIVTLDDKIPQICATELYHPDLEMQDKDDSFLHGYHHGVLDTHTTGPVPYHEVDSRCACCRRVEKPKTGRVIVKKM